MSSQSDNGSLRLRVSGPLACFTRPEFKAERLSYQVMTPSAARGILEAVLWKPAIVWRVQRIKVLAPIRWIAIRRNEVNNRAATPAAAVVDRGGPAPLFLADTSRDQRNTVALRDVDYVIEARFEMTPRAGPDDNPAKFVDMFRRRVERGQHYHQPYLGCREFAAEIAAVDEATPRPISVSIDLGMMLHDIIYQQQGNRALFFSAKLEEGVLEVPPVTVAASAAGGNP